MISKRGLFGIRWKWLFMAGLGYLIYKFRTPIMEKIKPWIEKCKTFMTKTETTTTQTP